jgi:YVTN family beta-propeller protein
MRASTGAIDGFSSPIAIVAMGLKMQNSRTLERSRSFTIVRFHLSSIALVIVTVIGVWGCGTSQSGNNEPPTPAPTITTISPNTAAAGGAAFTLTITGANYVTTSMVNFGGAASTTTFINSTELTAAIPAAAIAATGTPAVTVTNPAPGGGTSNAINFTVTSPGPGFGPTPQSIVVDPTGNFAYVMDSNCDDEGDGCVAMYTIDPATGALASIGPPVSSFGYGIDYGDGINAGSLTVDAFGKFAYVTNSGNIYNYDSEADGTLAMYTIDATTGALTSTGSVNGNCPGLCFPSTVVVDPSGKFAYVATGNNPGSAGSVLLYTINATTGVLTSSGAIDTGSGPVSVAVDPAGKFAYVTDWNSNDVSMYTIDATTGALTSIGTIAAGTDPAYVTVDPTSKFAYATNSDSSDVSMYTINATTGALTSIGTIATGTGPVSVAVDPAGKFAYVTNSNSNDVSMYTVDGTTGVLTPMGTVAAGLLPSSIAIHPSGKFAYVTNSNSNDVSMYSIDAATGVLTLIGTIGT